MRLAKFKDKIRFNKSVCDGSGVVFFEKVWYNVLVETKEANNNILFTIEVDGTKERLSLLALEKNNIAYELEGDIL